MRLTIGSANPDPQSAWFRPRFTLQGKPQMAVAGGPGLWCHRSVFFRHSFLPVDMDFFKIAVGVNGGKFGAHRRSFLNEFLCRFDATDGTHHVSNVLRWMRSKTRAIC